MKQPFIEHLIFASAKSAAVLFVVLLLNAQTSWVVANGRSSTEASDTRRGEVIELHLRSRDHKGHATEARLKLDTRKAAIVVVDVWTAHYCPAATAGMRSYIPHLNRALDAARKLGIQVVFASSGDDLKRWEGKPQRLGITSLPNYPMPKSNGFMKGAGLYGPFPAPCMEKVTEINPHTHEPIFHCERLPEHFNQNPGLIVRQQDLFIAAGHYRPGIKWAIDSWDEPAQQELWNLIRTRGITHLIYMGFSTNMCVINREFGMIEMRRLGMKTILVRDLTEAMTYNGYNPITKKLDPSWTPAVGTRHAVEFIEENIGPSITSSQLIHAADNSPYG